MVNKERLEEEYYTVWQVISPKGEVILHMDRLPRYLVLKILKESKNPCIVTKTTTTIVAEIENETVKISPTHSV